MKKLIFLLICLLVAAPVICAAEGSVTVTRHFVSDDARVAIIKLACVGDSGNGSVPNTTISTLDISGIRDNYFKKGYLLFEVWAVAGSPAPDAADITITDNNNLVLVGTGSANSGTNAIPASGSNEIEIAQFYGVTSPLTIAIANQDTASAQWTIYLILRK